MEEKRFIEGDIDETSFTERNEYFYKFCLSRIEERQRELNNDNDMDTAKRKQQNEVLAKLRNKIEEMYEENKETWDTCSGEIELYVEKYLEQLKKQKIVDPDIEKQIELDIKFAKERFYDRLRPSQLLFDTLQENDNLKKEAV